jgi:hypothetical protein
MIFETAHLRLRKDQFVDFEVQSVGQGYNTYPTLPHWSQVWKRENFLTTVEMKGTILEEKQSYENLE